MDNLEKTLPVKSWKSKIIHTQALSSTSVFRDTAYPGEFEMTILFPKNVKGAGYVNEISHHHLSKVYKDEYEVVLQNNSDYAMIEAQYYKGKLFLIVEWLGG